MIPGPDARRLRARVMLWWFIWLGVLASLMVLYFFLGRGPLPAPSAGDPLAHLAGFVPLFVSIVVRWLILPRAGDPRRGLALMVLGLALAEGCGVLGLVLGGPYRDSLFVLGVLGVTQYAPFYARKLHEPQASGFIPNN